MRIYCIHIRFNGDWILQKQNDEALPADAVRAALAEYFGEASVDAKTTLTEVIYTVRNDTNDRDELVKAVYGRIAGVYPELEGHEVYAYEQEGVVARCEDICVVYAVDCNEDAEEDLCLTVQNLIQSMHGWDDFKKICWEIVDIAPQIRKYKSFESFLFQNYLFSVNDGWGLSTALNYMAMLMEQLGLITWAGNKMPVELRLATKSEVGRYTPAEAYDLLRGDSEKQRLVCLDISEFMENTRRDELKRFLEDLVALEEDYIFAFRIPFIEPDALQSMTDVLSDILFTRVISVPPVSDEELWLCTQENLKQRGFTLSDEAKKVFFSRLSEEKSDGRFYGMQTIKKLTCEIMWLKHKADALLVDDSEGTEQPGEVISAMDIAALSTCFRQDERDGFAELTDMIGMEEITARLREIVAQVKLSMANENMDKPCLHMRFVGAPGTGKTTVARLVGKIFAEEGILRNGYFFEHTARDLCGEYLGQTAPKTAAICRDAYGSVLFIDEAYALYVGDEKASDYGKEALTTLVSEMENHRSDMVVIMAGYKDEMNTLMEGNAGLRSRMPFMLEFKSYTKAQLLEIFMLMVKKHFPYEESLVAAARSYFDALDQSYMDSKEFANARFVRNLYERTWSKAAVRMQLSGEKNIVLRGEDFVAASADREFSEKLMQHKSIGF